MLKTAEFCADITKNTKVSKELIEKQKKIKGHPLFAKDSKLFPFEESLISNQSASTRTNSREQKIKNSSKSEKKKIESSNDLILCGKFCEMTFNNCKFIEKISKQQQPKSSDQIYSQRKLNINNRYINKPVKMADSIINFDDINNFKPLKLPILSIFNSKPIPKKVSNNRILKKSQFSNRNLPNLAFK